MKTRNCPRLSNKEFCTTCPYPCYQPSQREAIRRVMRYAGPRMFLHNPVVAIRHLLATKHL